MSKSFSIHACIFLHHFIEIIEKWNHVIPSSFIVREIVMEAALNQFHFDSHQSLTFFIFFLFFLTKHPYNHQSLTFLISVRNSFHFTALFFMLLPFLFFGGGPKILYGDFIYALLTIDNSHMYIAKLLAYSA